MVHDLHAFDSLSVTALCDTTVNPLKGVNRQTVRPLRVAQAGAIHLLREEAHRRSDVRVVRSSPASETQRGRWRGAPTCAVTVGAPTLIRTGR